MACPNCGKTITRSSLRQVRHPKLRHAFSTSPINQRLGAFTYPQEWTNSTYHFNKSLAKTLPVATQHADHLLTAYATQQKNLLDPTNPLYLQTTRNNITARRRREDQFFVGRSSAKDFGDRMEVTAFVFDGVEAKEREERERREKRMGVKAEGDKKKKRRVPPGRGRIGGGGAGGAPGRSGGALRTGGGGATGGARTGGFGRPGGPPRAGGGGVRTGGFRRPSGGGGGGGGGGGEGAVRQRGPPAFRSLDLSGGSAPPRRE